MNEKVTLTKKEKEVLRLVASVGNCPDTYPLDVFTFCVDSLQRKGLVKGAWASGHELADVRLTDAGRSYIALNPTLQNPIDWRWIITTAVSIIAVIASIIALFLSCSK